VPPSSKSPPVIPAGNLHEPESAVADFGDESDLLLFYECRMPRASPREELVFGSTKAISQLADF